MSSLVNQAVKQEISLPQAFRFGQIDPNPKPEILQHQADGALGVLELFVGDFAGKGFNTIFRPSNSVDVTVFQTPITQTSPKDNVLELNPYSETLSFSKALGSVPNRGSGQQGDINLNGVPYLQSITDTGSQNGTGIHVENGFWMFVPASASNPKDTLLRMGSIPHGTTINAQGALPTITPGGPNIPSQGITPFIIGAPTQTILFDSQALNNPGTMRLPQSLPSFGITNELLSNPGSMLVHNNEQLNILQTQTFSVSTTDKSAGLNQPTAPCPGGGTANIAFLTPNANAVEMNATFWISTVEATLQIPVFQPGKTATPLRITPSISNRNPSLPAPPLPTFSVKPTKAITSPMQIKRTYTQIQYRQTVFLNFSGLTWPHVSVSTLVPKNEIVIPPEALAGNL